MTNEYFDSYSSLPRNQLARAEALNAIFDAIIVGFDTVPGSSAIKQDRLSFCTDTGTANAYVIAPTYPITSYQAGQRFSFVAVHANTGASTVNVSSQGAVALKRADGNDLASGDITAGRLVWVQHDGTNFQLMTPAGTDVIAAAASALAASGSASSASSSASSASGYASAASGYASAANNSAVAAASSASTASGVVAVHAALTSTHGVSGNIVGTSDTQTLTNKTMGATVFSSTIKYGGVTLSDAVTGTGKMVLDTNPTFTTKLTGPDGGTWDATGITASAATFTSGFVEVINMSAGQFAGAAVALANANSSMGNQGQTRLTHTIVDTEGSQGRFTVAQHAYDGTYVGDILQYDYETEAWIFRPGLTDTAQFNSTGLLLGTTSNPDGRQLVVYSANNAAIQAISNNASNESVDFRNNATSGTRYYAYFRTMSGTSPVITGSISSDGTSTTYATTSDERLKNWFIVQTDYRKAIRSLWVGDFEWKADGRRAFGVRAQQAYECMPNHQGVKKPEKDEGQWEASAEPFGHLALWGVKDLYELIEAQAARIVALEARVS